MRKVIAVSINCTCVFFLSIVIFVSCSRKDVPKSPVFMTLLNGEATINRQQEETALNKVSDAKNGDIITTHENTLLKLMLDSQKVVFVNEKSIIKIEYVNNNDGKTQVTLTLLGGEIYLENTETEQHNIQCAIMTPVVSLVHENSSFSVSYFKKQKFIVVKSYFSNTVIYPPNKESVVIPQCHKILVKSDGFFNNIVTLSTDDISQITQWLTPSGQNPVTEFSICSQIEEPVKENQPPVWQNQPGKQGTPKKMYTDAVLATDPEGSQISYSLIEGPSGMIVDENSGKIQYMPGKPGSHFIRIAASDEDGKTAFMEYHLHIVGQMNAVLKAPSKIKIGEPCTFDASASVNAMGTTEGLQFRFDINNDKKWDYPKGNSFSPTSSITHTFNTEGVYTVAVQVQDVDKKIATTRKKVTVFTPLAIELSCDPQRGVVGTEFHLSVNTNSAVRLRWDLNGDGAWDYPEDGSFGDDLSIRHIWERAGMYTVTVEGSDQYGNKVNTSAPVTIYHGITIDSLTGPDTVNVHDSFTVTCYASDPEFNITEYAWDFAGVGMFSKKSPSPSVQLAYKEAGIYTLVCAVTNEKGLSSSESKTIFIVNDSTTVDAGGPYTAQINKPCTVEGYAKDADNTIVDFCWDCNNDGTFELQSTTTAKAQCIFTRKGTFTVRFKVTTDDGKTSEDTAVIEVINNPPHADAGEDQVVRPKRKVELTGHGTDEDGNIAAYEWDFDCDGNYDWKSTDTGYVEHEFLEYSTPVLRVTDTEGAFSTDTVHIIICPKGMATIEEQKFCIDIYEWPNKKGETPVSNISYDDAVNECKKVNKRLCTADELNFACKGNEKRYQYPYGRRYEPDNCNSLGNRHLKNQKGLSGEFVECVSKYDVYDMTGNVAEWTSSGDGETRFVAGGWWQNGEKRAQCGAVVPMEKHKKYFFVGFRCCK